MQSLMLALAWPWELAQVDPKRGKPDMGKRSKAGVLKTSDIAWENPDGYHG